MDVISGARFEVLFWKGIDFGGNRIDKADFA